jgi:hypothetical protein
MESTLLLVEFTSNRAAKQKRLMACRALRACRS